MIEYLDGSDEKSLDSLEGSYRTKAFDRMFSGEAQSGYSDLTAIVNPRILKSIYMSEDWIYILVDRIASKLAQIPWQVYKDTKPGGEEVLEPALNHPVQKILDNPNPLQPSYAFKYACITDLSVTGNCLIYISRQNRWLVQVPTEIISLDITGRGELRGYDVVGIDPMAFPVGMKTKIRPEDVAHIRRPNASSVFWGLSPLIPGANPSLFNKYSNEYLLNFYRKGAQPGLILEMGEGSSENQAKKLLQSLETAYTGRSAQRRAMIMPNGVKVTTLAHTLADQQLIEYLRNNRETLINIFGVPKHELSIAEAGSLGSEEYKTALKNFWQGPLMSIGAMFESALTEKLKPFLGEQYKIRLNYSGIPILQEDLNEKAMLASSMLSTMTYNEVRQKVWKLAPVRGGDYIPSMQQSAFSSFPSLPSLANTEPSLLPAEGDQTLEPQPQEESIAKTSLNGAQVASLVQVVQSVAAGLLPRDAGISIIQVSFQLSREEAEAVMGSVGDGFVPSKPVEDQQTLSIDEELDDGADFEQKAVPQKYEKISFTPPDDVAEQAKIGLEWRKKYGRGGTEVGVARATQLKNKRTVSPDTINRMKSYFARHSGEGDNKEQNGEPSAGAIAWKLWGGDAGQRWSSKVSGQMDSADEKEKSLEVSSEYQKQNVEAFSNYVKSDGGAWFRDRQSMLEEEAKSKIDALQNLWLDILGKQVVKAVGVLKKQAKEKAVDIPSKVKLRKELMKAMDDLEDQWTKGYVDTLTSQVELGYNSVLEIPFNKPYLEGIDAIRSRNAEGRRQVLADRGLETFSNISKTTTETIMRTITSGMEESLTLQEIAGQIQNIGKVSAARAMTIARTEVLTANSIGSNEAMKDAAEFIPNMVKVWVNAGDERVRGNPDGEYPESKADHWDQRSGTGVGGQIVKFDEPFRNGLMFPRDPSGPPGETINCRCTLLTVSEDDLSQLGLKR